MQYRVYHNNGNSSVYPYLLDVQSDIIAVLHTRLVIPLFPRKKLKTQPAQRLNPIISIEGGDYVVMTHEMASVRLSQLGDQVADVRPYRQHIKDALDFLLDGF